MLMVFSKHGSVLGRPFHMLIVGGHMVDFKTRKSYLNLAGGPNM